MYSCTLHTSQSAHMDPSPRTKPSSHAPDNRPVPQRHFSCHRACPFWRLTRRILCKTPLDRHEQRVFKGPEGLSKLCHPPPSEDQAAPKRHRIMCDPCSHEPPPPHVAMFGTVVEGGRGRLGHRSPFSTCQCARSDGASTGVDPQKERRASAANWFWQAMISVARPPPATETTPAW